MPVHAATDEKVSRVAAVRDYLPRGNLLDDTTFHRRHVLLSWILGLHIPALFAFGVWQGHGVQHSALAMALPAALLVFGQVARHRRVAAFFVTAGLVFCSTVLVHLSGGMIEAHFHFFILIGLIALYEDWVPFVWNVVFVVASHGLGDTVAADLMYNHSAAQNRPWHWAVIHGVSVLAACAGVIVFWRNVEEEKRRSAAFTAELGEAEVAAVQAEAAQRRTISQLYVDLARRNQSLLDRQLQLIGALEHKEREPGELGDLFRLDHLATRMRRNAESLLVLSGAEPARQWGRPVPLADVVRAAAAEVEHYQRVDVLVSSHLTVSGSHVADLSHLLAELIENATTYSPPTSRVRIGIHPAPNADAPYLLSIEDVGIGMPDSDLRASNAILAEPPDVDAEGAQLGFQVVGRLARRLGSHVSLVPTPAGGTTALVTLPDGLLTDEPVVGNASSHPPAFVPAIADGLADGTQASANGSTNGRASGTATGDRTGTATPTRAEPIPATATPVPTTTPDGLARRVPGANLASGLRRQPDGDADGGGIGGEEPPTPRRDLAQAGALLSRFQASQRAGRAAAGDIGDLGGDGGGDPGGDGGGDIGGDGAGDPGGDGGDSDGGGDDPGGEDGDADSRPGAPGAADA